MLLYVLICCYVITVLGIYNSIHLIIIIQLTYIKSAINKYNTLSDMGKCMNYYSYGIILSTPHKQIIFINAFRLSQHYCNGNLSKTS